MTNTEFDSLKPGDAIRSVVDPSQVFTVGKKTAYGYQIRQPGKKRPGKAITPSAWAKVTP